VPEDAGDEPRSLLFLSCDIVGSTSYKQKSGDTWRKTFLTFYRDFPQALGDETRRRDYSRDFKLWKAVGDELIFTVHVLKEADVSDAVRIWLAAMDTYEKQIEKENLATKGSAFIATFPGPDSESSIPLDPTQEVSDRGVVELNRDALKSRDRGKYLFDYFGPSIDTGFRVASQCSQRFFTLSIEVAWAIARARQDVSTVPFNDVCFVGSPTLKGVWNSREYPLFAIDRHHADPINTAMSRIASDNVDHGSVADLCAACHAEPGWPSRLYLPASGLGSLNETPKDSLAELEDNDMQGAESVPEVDVAPAAPLNTDPPMS
jgi:hypothetical protein